RAAEGHQFMVNPTFQQTETSDLDLVVAATRDAIVMVEGGAAQLNEDVMIDALLFAHQACQPLIDLIEKVRATAGKTKREFAVAQKDPAIFARANELGLDRLRAATAIREKLERNSTIAQVSKEIATQLEPEFLDAEGKPRAKEVAGAVADVHKKFVRQMVVDEGSRIDGRKTTDIRPIACEVGLIPRQHGSAL